MSDCMHGFDCPICTGNWYNNWISVEDKLPKHMKNVIVSAGWPFIGNYDYEEGKWYHWSHQKGYWIEMPYEVKKWMPFPPTLEDA